MSLVEGETYKVKIQDGNKPEKEFTAEDFVAIDGGLIRFVLKTNEDGTEKVKYIPSHKVTIDGVEDYDEDEYEENEDPEVTSEDEF